MEKIELHIAGPTKQDYGTYVGVTKNKGASFTVYESAPVDALVEALRKIHNCPTDVFIAERALLVFEQSGNTGELEIENEKEAQEKD